MMKAMFSVWWLTCGSLNVMWGRRGGMVVSDVVVVDR